ncbi:MAG: nicotinic acid mononucleotide adenylyltransferase [Candidatus Contendobacter odensis]|uniref:Probable nicotinate-nucleotide adenylyltransferase n=1 Tax=Candidatus Contendibacter odensensis TaxID=1400860 RepID=A0A2G6PFG8_9GAMM|nr:MAG: nicotinic acid mononucleotide adenylyltransferase [Candidatus Contendobacter odensis]
MTSPRTSDDRKPIGIFGGTFDPIHYGHLRPALDLLETLDLEEVRFIPCRIPAHRDTPHITAEQRLALVKRATTGQHGFIADDRELRREGTSYMVDTLNSLRQDFGNDKPLCLLVGTDAFYGLHTWNRWQQLIQTAHIVVMQRPGVSRHLQPVLKEFITPRTVDNPHILHQQAAGHILFQAVSQLDISATQIRNLLAQNRSPRYLLPDAVLTFIHEQRLYQH